MRLGFLSSDGSAPDAAASAVLRFSEIHAARNIFRGSGHCVGARISICRRLPISGEGNECASVHHGQLFKRWVIRLLLLLEHATETRLLYGWPQGAICTRKEAGSYLHCIFTSRPDSPVGLAPHLHGCGRWEDCFDAMDARIFPAGGSLR